MFLPLHDLQRYQCPDEPGEISHAVHLARLAAGYGRCEQCPHRGTDKSWDQPLGTVARTSTPSLQRMPAGIRGVYLNQLGRQQAIPWAAALADMLWNEFPPVFFPAGQERNDIEPTSCSAPLVVVGYDERPAAPDVLAGAVMGLTRMSCQVVEIGLSTEPCLRFAVQHLNADAGLLITGAGGDVSRIGLDVICRNGLPPETSFLDHWCEQQQASHSRRSRSASQPRACSPLADYETQLWRHFHALRPLHVVCGAVSQQVLTRLERILARLPGKLTTIKLPIRPRNLSHPEDVDVQRVGQRVQQDGAQLGVVVDEDGAGCAFLDERGRLAPDLRWQRLVVDHLLQEEPTGKIVLGTSAWDELSPRVTANHGVPLLVAEQDRAARLLAERALAAIGSDHRLWLRGETLVCDAITTLAVMMQVLSRSDAEFSLRLAQG